MSSNEYPKAFIHHLKTSIDYLSGSIVVRSVLRKKTGTITVSSFDTGEELLSKSSPFDNLIQVIDGEAELTIDEQLNKVKSGESIIIPAHSKNSIVANKRFKMISTVIKSGYDEVSP